MRASAVLGLLVAGCAVRAPALTKNHPASPTAETGRLAGAPPALRPGVVDYKEVPALRRDDADAGGGHEHHKH